MLLVGLMGAGKTTVGRALADRLGVDYLDNDLLLEAREGAGAIELASHGIHVLHDAESRQLAAVCERSGPFVAGVAASAADRPDDCRLVREAATVVYLRATADVLAARVRADTARPWVGEHPTTVLSEMYQRRDPVYMAVAHMTIEVDQPLERVVAQIASALPPSDAG